MNVNFSFKPFIFLILLLVLCLEEGAMSRQYLSDEKLYFIENGKVYHHFGSENGEPLENADANSFKVFDLTEFKYNYSIRLAGDKNGFYLARDFVPYKDAHKVKVLAPYNHGDCTHLFVHENKLYKINQNEKKTEEITGNFKVPELKYYPSSHQNGSPKYFKDSKAVYFYRIYENRMAELKNAELKSFAAYNSSDHFNAYWAKDDKTVFFEEKVIQKADPVSFKYMGSGYALDKRAIYFLSNAGYFEIPNSDPATFSEVDSEDNSFDAMDKNHRYLNGRVVR